MRKLKASGSGAVLLAAATGCLLPGTASGVILGPDPALCQRNDGPAMLVRVEGLKARTGLLRVQSYGGDPASYFEKGAYLRRVEVPVPPAGPVEVCVPVAHPGTYAVSVRHDLNGDHRSDSSDGGGLSGNPRVSLFDVMVHRKPDPKVVAVPVRGLTTVPVILNYVQGLSFGPVARGGS